MSWYIEDILTLIAAVMTILMLYFNNLRSHAHMLDKLICPVVRFYPVKAKYNDYKK